MPEEATPQDIKEFSDMLAKINELTLSRHQPFIMSGCSGVGKGTLVKYLLSKFPHIFELSVSYTTRKPRQGELHGREYYFVDVDTFLEEAHKDVFVEYGQIYGNYYGTHRGQVQRIMKKGKICLLQIDLKAAQKIHADNPDYNFLFINVPHFQQLRERMRKRGSETQESIERRMQHSLKELEKIKELTFYQHIVNENLERTKIELVEYLNRKYELGLTP